MDYKIDQMILHLHNEERKSIRKIKELLKVGHLRIRNVISAFEKNEIFFHKKGRPMKVTDEIKSLIELETLKNASVTAFQLSQIISEHFNLNFSITTINKYRNKLKFKWRPPKIRQSLNEFHKKIGYQFCNEMIEGQFVEKVIIFSDESRFEQLSDSSWRWIRHGELNESSFNTKSNSKNSVMVWGAIGLNLKSNLIFINQKIDSDMYIKTILESGLISQADLIYSKYGWFFQQDGAPCHHSSKSLEYLNKNVNLLPSWPPNSPNSNPIELFWGIMKNFIKKKK